MALSTRFESVPCASMRIEPAPAALTAVSAVPALPTVPSFSVIEPCATSTMLPTTPLVVRSAWLAPTVAVAACASTRCTLTLTLSTVTPPVCAK